MQDFAKMLQNLAKMLQEMYFSSTSVGSLIPHHPKTTKVVWCVSEIIESLGIPVEISNRWYNRPVTEAPADRNHQTWLAAEKPR